MRIAFHSAVTRERQCHMLCIEERQSIDAVFFVKLRRALIIDRLLLY